MVRTNIDKLRTDFSTSKGLDQFSCAHFPACSGCRFQQNVASPPIWKQVIEYFGSKNFSSQVELKTQEIIGWRTKSKLSVRGTSKFPQIGLYKEGTHDVVNMQECPLHTSSMNEALSLVRKNIMRFGIEPYNESTGRGRIKYLQMVSQRKTGKIQLSLVVHGENLHEEEKIFVKQLYNDWNLWHSIWINYLPEKTNRILGDRWEKIYGEETFWQEIAGMAFCFHPSCFSQAHLSMFEEMLFFIKGITEPQSHLLELYAGVGVIGLYLAPFLKKIALVESSPEAQSCFFKSLSRLPADFKEKTKFIQAKAEECESLFDEVDVVVVDPPRKGLSKVSKGYIFSSSAKQVIYVSCGFDSLKRDCDEFLDQGWSLHAVRGFLLFPGTDHVEMIVSFKRDGKV